MARKDVDLVIRARDQAAKVVEQITDAINAFNTAQGKMTTGATKTEGAMTALGSAFTKLDSAIKGMQAAEKVSRDFARAQEATNRLRSSLDQVEGQARDTARALTQMDARTEQLSGKVTGATQALNTQRGALREAAAAQGVLSGQITNTQSKLERLTADIAKSNAATDEKVTKLDAARARYSQLEAEIAAVEKPTKRLTSQFEAAGRASDRASAALDKQRAETAALEAELQQATAELDRLETEHRQATATTSRYERMVARTRDSLARHRTELRAASGAQRALSEQNSRATETAARLSSEYDRASTELVELRANADAATTAVQRLAGASAGTARREGMSRRDETTNAAFAVEANYRQAVQEANRLAAEIGRVGVPTREMSAAFQQAKNTAAQLKQEMQIMRTALGETRQAYAMMDGTVEGNRAGLERMIAAQNRMVAALQQVRAAAATNAQAIRQTHTATRDLDRSTRNLNAAQDPARVSRFAAAMRALGHEKRTSLSWAQRLRGEVLSLVAAYAGLYGVIGALGQVVKATQTVEAAQSRLNVAMQGTGRDPGDEMDYIRRQADRLGIEFGVLAQEYSKFAIATQGTNLQGQRTRDIFEAVAEAARVNKNSTDEMAGVFMALTQIVSKGAVQMEELRQQLGDRLPGALQIMADGLRVGTDELIKMMEQGQVSSDALIGFGEELRRRFGPGLAAALTTTSAELGRFKNATFQALVAFGEAGFIESFNSLLRDLTETMRSPEFVTTMERLSVAIGAVVEGLGWLVRNFQLVAAAATALIGVKVYSTFVQARAAIMATGAAAATTGARMGIAARGVVGMTRAIQGLMSTTLPGLLLTGASALIGFWLTSASDVNEALTEHVRIMDAVKNAYEQTGGALDEWRTKISEAVTLTEARANVESLEDALESLRRELAVSILGTQGANQNFFGQALIPFYRELTRASRDYRREAEALYRQWRDGAITGEELRTQVDALNEAHNDGSEGNKRLAREMVNVANRIVEMEANLGDARGALTAMTGEAGEAAEALDELAGAGDDAGAAARAAAQKAEQFAKAMAELRDAIPQVKRELDYLAASDAIDEQLRLAISLASTWGEVAEAIRLAGQAQGALRTDFFDTSTSGRVTPGLYDWFLREEGMRTEAYQDQGGVWTIGLGHTSAAGGLQVGPGTTITEAEALALFDRDIARFAARVDNAVRVPITEAMRTALISYDYNTGAIVGSRIVELLNAGDYTGAQQALAGGIATIQGQPSAALRNRRQREAELFGSQGLTTPEIAYAAGERDVEAATRAAEEAERRAEAAREFHETQNRSIADSEFELSVQNQGLVARETALALREAELAAQKAGTTLTEEQRQAIIATTEAKYRQQEIDERIADTRERATKAEERVNALTTQRAALLEQMQFAANAGDTEGAEALRAQIAAINEQLIQAITNAQAMWQAVGGDVAEAAIARLETAKIAAQNFNAEGRQGLIDWKRVGDLFVDGLTNAFGEFAKAVAEGTSIGEAARNAFLKFAADFLIQIGQMIIKQAILNALRGTSLGGLFGIPAVAVPVAHTGAVVGSGGGSRRSVSPALFAGAARYHQGGFPGLGPTEVPIIAERGEQILAKDDPLNALNGGGAPAGGAPAPTPRPVKIVNRLSSREVAQAVFDDDDGSEVIENYFRVNATKLAAILQGG